MISIASGAQIKYIENNIYLVISLLKKEKIMCIIGFTFVCHILKNKKISFVYNVIFFKLLIKR